MFQLHASLVVAAAFSMSPPAGPGALTANPSGPSAIPYARPYASPYAGPSVRATEFVVTVATRDLARARAGRPHGLSYVTDETPRALASALRKWLAGEGDAGLRLGIVDRLTLFSFFWAAQQMPVSSPCFRRPDGDPCEIELARWLAEVRRGSPAFLAAYRKAQGPLRLPALRD